jgi:hypothetical protein
MRQQTFCEELSSFLSRYDYGLRHAGLKYATLLDCVWRVTELLSVTKLPK